jgi:hypothetical protein
MHLLNGWRAFPTATTYDFRGPLLTASYHSKPITAYSTACLTGTGYLGHAYLSFVFCMYERSELVEFFAQYTPGLDGDAGDPATRQACVVQLLDRCPLPPEYVIDAVLAIVAHTFCCSLCAIRAFYWFLFLVQHVCPTPPPPESGGR